MAGLVIRAMAGAKGVDVAQRGQDEPGLRSVDDVDQDVPPGRFGGANGGIHPVGDLGRRTGSAIGVADWNVDQLDMHLADPRNRIAGANRDFERGLAGEIAAMSGVDTAASDLVGAEEDVVYALCPAAGGAGQSDIFEIRSRGGEDDVDVLGDRIGAADSAAQPFEPIRVDRPVRIRPHLRQQRLDPSEGFGRDVVGGRGSVSEDSARARRGMIAVEAGFRIEDDPGVAARGHQQGRGE
jgi:hypothetical protein